jgi:hypothetical protein
VSFGPVVNGAATNGWHVRFAVLAALCAALGRLGKAQRLPLVTAVLAWAGFLDALSSAVTFDGGWPLTTITVLNGPQAATAVAALITAPETTDDSTAAGYEAYVDYYNQAVRNYYSQQTWPTPQEQTQASARGQAMADAQAEARVQRRDRPSQYGDYTHLDRSVSRGSTAMERDSGGSIAEQPTGLPTVGRANASADDQRGSAEKSAWQSPTE